MPKRSSHTSAPGRGRSGSGSTVPSRRRQVPFRPSGVDPGRRSIAAVFLDFGGTVVRPRRALLPFFRVAARRAGVRVPWTEFLRANETVWAELWPRGPSLVGHRPSFADLVHEHALRRAGARGPLMRMVRTIRAEATSPRWHRPYAETPRVLARMRALGLSLHLISNNVDYLPVLLGRLGWAHTFDTVTYSQELGHSKPDLRIFRTALRRAACPPDRALYVGDSWEADYLGARGAGMEAVWLNRRAKRPPGPCRQIRRLDELPALLSRLD